MSVWIRHVQTQDSGERLEYFENLTYSGQVPQSDLADQIVLDGHAYSLANFDLVVVEEPASSGDLRARVYFNHVGTQPNLVLSGPAARSLRDALLERTVTEDQ